MFVKSAFSMQSQANRARLRIFTGLNLPIKLSAKVGKGISFGAFLVIWTAALFPHWCAIRFATVKLISPQKRIPPA